MSAGYTIGVRGCQHLGYQPTGMRVHRATGWNQRVVDGHVAHELTMRSMLDAGVNGIVDGGDLTHWNRPLPRDVEVANRVDDLRAAAGVWAVGNSGNHCAGGGSDLSAMGVMHRPALGIRAVFPDPNGAPDGAIGPHPGLYEVHTRADNPHLPDGLALHFVSHYGLSRDLADAGITIDPTPLPGMVNLFFSHGTFATDERLYQCIDPHGEERPIPGEWALRGWDAMILSHYHTLGAVPGYGTGERGQVWYTGSSLRRGFSDEPGMRGWLAVTVHDTGSVTVTPHAIWQRPQHDLPTVDATGLTVTDLAFVSLLEGELLAGTRNECYATFGRFTATAHGELDPTDPEVLGVRWVPLAEVESLVRYGPPPECEERNPLIWLPTCDFILGKARTYYPI